MLLALQVWLQRAPMLSQPGRLAQQALQQQAQV
jgi:hypothetical protein